MFADDTSLTAAEETLGEVEKKANEDLKNIRIYASYTQNYTNFTFVIRIHFQFKSIKDNICESFCFIAKKRTLTNTKFLAFWLHSSGCAKIAGLRRRRQKDQ